LITFWRLVLAVLVAPLVVPVVLDVSFTLLPGGAQGITGSGTLLFAYFVLAFSYPVTIAVGLPLLFVFRSQGWLGKRAFALAGSVLGLATILLVNPDFDWGGRDVPFLVSCAAAGAVAALVFRQIALAGQNRRPLP
jgi:hypothetical protein